MLDKLDGNENEYNEINYQTFSTGKYLATENDSFIVEELYEKNFPIETTYKGFSTISEEILSTGTQTTLERNTNYYFRFIARFPDDSDVRLTNNAKLENR